MLSYTCKTAIKAVIYLSSKSTLGEKVSIKDIAEPLHASQHTMGKILQLLARKKMITSLKGPNGGFYLDEKQQVQPVINIVQAIEGDYIFKECGLGLSECSASHPCPIHHEYKKAREIMEKIFNENTVESLCNSVNDGLTHLIG